MHAKQAFWSGAEQADCVTVDGLGMLFALSGCAGRFERWFGYAPTVGHEHAWPALR